MRPKEKRRIMAHLNYHGKLIRSWKSLHTHLTVYLTETGWMLSTVGPRGGKCKVLAKPAQTVKKERLFHVLSNTDKFVSKIEFQDRGE
jgi:hypothetical protein